MSNVFNNFRKIFKSDILLTGTVITHNSDGTSSLTDYQGREFIAQGQNVAVASRAFVKDGRIQGEAPTLTESTVYV